MIDKKELEKQLKQYSDQDIIVLFDWVNGKEYEIGEIIITESKISLVFSGYPEE